MFLGIAVPSTWAQGTQKVRLPISFDNTAVNYDLVAFGNATGEIVADPTNAANKVGKMTKPDGAETWAGVVVGNGGLEVPIQFSQGNTTFTMDVYSPVAGIQVLLKVENAATSAINVEKTATITQANTWQKLSFDFSTGTPALNLSNTYSKVVVFMNFGQTGAADGDAVYYWDNISHPATDNYQGTVIGNDLPVTFDLAGKDYLLADFGGTASELTADPMNAANKVAKTTKTNSAELWAGTTVFGSAGFDAKIPLAANSTKMNVRVYSPHSGIQVRLKVEDPADGNKSVETEATVTKANEWQTLEFDFSKHASGTAAIDYTYTYRKASIFFNFGVTGAVAGERVYYWDDLKFGAASSVPVEQEQLPLAIALDQNYPNPFNPSTTIRYQVEKAGMVKLTVFDLLGRVVSVPVSAPQMAGSYSVQFDATGLTSGTYIYRLEMDGQQVERRMTLLR